LVDGHCFRWSRFFAAPQAQAQVSVDVAKITCRQLLFDKVISPNSKSLALWLSGYYNGQARQYRPRYRRAGEKKSTRSRIIAG